jgi:hypothetical protein
MNHVALRTWDIDHVLVGPGGVIAVETKWSSYGWKLAPPDAGVMRAVDQVRNNAKDLRQWHDLHSLGIESVRPVAFLWGRDQDDPQPMPSAPLQIGEVTIITGVQAARAWRTSIVTTAESQAHDPEHIRRLWDALDGRIQKRDSYVLATSPPPPPTLGWIYWTAFSVAAAAIASFLLGLQAVRVGSWWGWSACILVLAAIGLSARRVRVLRLGGLGWLAGVGAAVLLVAVLELYRAIV